MEGLGKENHQIYLECSHVDSVDAETSNQPNLESSHEGKQTMKTHANSGILQEAVAQQVVIHFSSFFHDWGEIIWAVASINSRTHRKSAITYRSQVWFMIHDSTKNTLQTSSHSSSRGTWGHSPTPHSGPRKRSRNLCCSKPGLSSARLTPSLAIKRWMFWLMGADRLISSGAKRG